MKKYRFFMKNSVIMAIILFSTAVLLNCSPERYYNEAAIIVRKMSIEDMISQMLISSIPGREANEAADEIIRKYRPGGIILFGYNLSSKEQTAGYIHHLQKLSEKYSGMPMFISIDQEGGRVRRITDGVTLFPGAMPAGIAGEKSLAERWGKSIAMELRKMGFNLNFAPVLDVNNNPANPVINTRSFGSDKHVVAELGTAYLKGQQSSGVISAAKHFPGHGDTDRDSHYTLPVIDHRLDRLREIELFPFRQAIQSGVDMVMTAHIAFPGILDSHEPATHSSFFLKDILRDEMGFKGVVITDCLEMAAVAERTDIGESAVRSVEAGADILLFTAHSNSLPLVNSALLEAVKTGRITEERIESSVKRIIELKIRYGIIQVDDVNVSFPDYPPEKLRAEAAEVNSEISRRAIYLHNGSALSFSEQKEKLIVSGNRILRDYLENNENIKFFSSMENAFASASGSDSLVVYHLQNPSPGATREFQRLIEKMEVPGVILYSGNPFSAAAISGHLPVLFTFSSTPESLRQAAACIAGEFEPLDEINYDIGFPGQK